MASAIENEWREVTVTKLEPKVEEPVVIVAPKATVYVERAIQVRQYEPLKVGIHFPVDLPLVEVEGEGYHDAVDAAIKAAFFTAKAHVYEQAGVKFEDKDGVLVEMVTAKFEGSAEVVSSPRPTAVPPPSSGDTRQGPNPATAGPVPPCPDCGSDQWDNRVKKYLGEYKPSASDFRCKSKSCGKSHWIGR